MIDLESFIVFCSFLIAFIGFMCLTQRNKQCLVFFLVSLLLLAKTLENYYALGLTGFCMGIILRTIYDILGKNGD